MVCFFFSALFLLREPDSLEGIPEDIKKDYQDTAELCIEKLKALKNVITNTFEVTFLINFSCYLFNLLIPT